MGKTKDFSALDTAITKKQPAQDNPEPKSKALTLKLTASEYDQLRTYAFNHRTTHQDIIHTALLEYLGR